jgi:hypothetical protein
MINYHINLKKFNAILYWNSGADIFATEDDLLKFLNLYRDTLVIEDTLQESKLIQLCNEFATNQDIKFGHSYAPNDKIVLFFYPEELELTQSYLDRMAKDA